MTTRWEDLFKVKIANHDDSFQKHECIKLLIVMKLLQKNRHTKNFIRIYTEFPLIDNKRADVYYENAKTKEAVVYEIQNKFTIKWLEETKHAYDNLTIPFMNSFDFIPININDFSDNIQEINKQLDKYII